MVVFEAGAQVASNLRSVGHVRLFSPWRYNVDRSAVTSATLGLAGFGALAMPRSPQAARRSEVEGDVEEVQAGGGDRRARPR